MSAETYSSSVLDVTDALLELLSDGAPAETYIGWANVKHGKSRSIEVGAIEDGLHSYPVVRAGRKPREEAYSIILKIRSRERGSDARQAVADVMRLLKLVEDVVADDVNLGLTDTYPTLRAGVDEWEIETKIADQRLGWEADMSVKLRVETRLN